MPGLTRGYEVIAERLVHAGVDTIFGLMGAGNLDLVPHWVHDLGRRYVAARHESAAVAMASGYSRVSDRLGVCTVTHGPGLTNALTALTTATRAGSRLLLIAGDVAPAARLGHNQRIEQRAVVAPSGAAFIDLDSPDIGRDRLAAVLAASEADQGPVVLNSPVHVQEADWPVSDGGVRAGQPLRQVVRPDREVMAAVRRLVATSSRPVIIAGRGALSAAAKQELEALGAFLGAPLATTLQAKDLFRDHPLDIGIAGGFSTRLAVSLLTEADCALVFGASLHPATTQDGALLAGAEVVQFDVRPERLAIHRPVALPVLGDAAACAGELRAILSGASAPERERYESAVRAIAEFRAGERARSDAEDGRWGGTEFTRRLDGLLPRERTVVVDSGHFMGYPGMELSVPDPAGFVYTTDFGTVGLGVGTAIGAAIGRPARLTVAVVGDGGLMMALGDLETAARYRIPILFVVMNDGAFGSEVHHLRHKGWPVDTAVFANPDFVAVAEAVGMRGLTVASAGDVARVAEAIDGLDRPLLLDVKLAHDEPAPYFTRNWAAVQAPDPVP